MMLVRVHYNIKIVEMRCPVAAVSVVRWLVVTMPVWVHIYIARGDVEVVAGSDASADAL